MHQELFQGFICFLNNKVSLDYFRSKINNSYQVLSILFESNGKATGMLFFLAFIKYLKISIQFNQKNTIFLRIFCYYTAYKTKKKKRIKKTLSAQHLTKI